MVHELKFHIASEKEVPKLHQVFGISLKGSHELKFGKTIIKINKEISDEYFTLKCYDDKKKLLNLSVYNFASDDETTPQQLEEISSYMIADTSTLSLVVLLNVPKRHINCVKYIFTQERYMKYNYLHGEMDGSKILFISPKQVQIKAPGKNITDADMDTNYEISTAFDKIDAEKLIGLINKYRANSDT